MVVGGRGKGWGGVVVMRVGGMRRCGGDEEGGRGKG